MNFHLPSYSEVYGKHRNADELRQIERQNRALEAQSFQYGDPVNTPAKRPMLVHMLVRLFTLFFP
jgi:hypothetical protein